MAKYLNAVYLLAAVVFAITLFFFQAANFTEAEDSLPIVNSILSGTPFLHPNHLLFEPVYHALLSVILELFPEVDRLALLQSITAVCGMGALVLIAALVGSRAGSFGGFVAASVVGTSYAFWLYAKVVDVYVPALFFGLLSLWLFHCRDRTPTLLNAALIALAASAATLMHQMYLLLGILTVIAVLRDTRAEHARYLHAAVMLLIGLVCVLGTYIQAYLVATGEWTSMRAFVAWALGHASGGLWDPPGLKTPIEGMIGVVTTMFTPFIAVELASSIGADTIASRSIIEEIFLASQSISHGLALLGLIGVACVGAVYLSILWISFRKPSKPFTVFDQLICISIFLYAVFTLVWEALNREFWLHIIAFTVIVCVIRTDWSRAGLKVIAVCAVVLAGVINFSMGILPLSDRKNDYFHVMIDHIVDSTQPNDAIVIDCSWLCIQYLKNEPSRIWLIPGATNDFASAISKAQRVVVVNWTYFPPSPSQIGNSAWREKFLADMEAMYGKPPFSSPTSVFDLPRFQASAARGSWEAVSP